MIIYYATVHYYWDKARTLPTLGHHTSQITHLVQLWTTINKSKWDMYIKWVQNKKVEQFLRVSEKVDRQGREWRSFKIICSLICLYQEEDLADFDRFYTTVIWHKNEPMNARKKIRTKYTFSFRTFCASTHSLNAPTWYAGIWTYILAFRVLLVFDSMRFEIAIFLRVSIFVFCIFVLKGGDGFYWLTHISVSLWLLP